MAIRLQSEFSDNLGLTYQVNIHDDTYTGAIIPFTIGGDGFVLNYEGNVETRYEPIIGSFLEFTLIEQNSDHSDFLGDLILSPEGRYLVSVRYDPDGVDTLYWGGVILAEQLLLADQAYPIENRIRATDDLANLKDILYNDNGSPYTNAGFGFTFIKHLTLGLSKLRTTALWANDTPFLRAVASYTPGNITTGDYYSNLRVTHATFYNYEEETDQKNYYDTAFVLAQFAISLGARIYQANGTFWFTPVGKQVASATLSALAYDKQGDYLSASNVSTNIDIGVGIKKLRGWQYGYQLPLKKVRRLFEHNNAGPAFVASYAPADHGTTTVVLNEFDYTNGQVFRLLLHNVWNEDSDYPGENNYHFQRRIKLKVKCGNRYLRNTVTNTAATAYLPPFGQAIPYTYPSPQTASWTTNAADRFTISGAPQNPATDNIGDAQFFQLDLPALPADLSGLEVTVYFDVLELDAGVNTDQTNAAQPTTYVILQYSGEAEDAVAYSATSSNANTAVLEQERVILGDAFETTAIGRIEVKTGSTTWDDPTTWTSSVVTTGTQDLHELGVREILFGQNTPRLRQSGQAYLPVELTVPQMYSTFTYDGRRYAPYTLNYYAKERLQDLELYELHAADGSITVAVDERIRKGPRFQNLTSDGGGKSLQAQISSNLQGATLSTIDSKLELIYKTFQPVGDDYASTKITYEEDKTDGMSVELTSSSILMASASGNSTVTLSENSPGIFEVYLQDNETPGAQQLVMYATADKIKAGLVGINTAAPDSALHVVGQAKVQGNIVVSGTVDGVDISALKTTVDGLSVGTGDTSNFWAFYLAD
jgi:hypothetical protein